jgi:hypothetical protein
MKLKLTEPSINFNILRLTSETWEIGIRRVLFGYRVSGNRLGFDFYCVDWCCGADETLALRVLCCLTKIIESHELNLSEKELIALLPMPNVLKYYEPEFSIDLLERRAEEPSLRQGN